MNTIQITELSFEEGSLVRKCSGFGDSAHKVGHKVFFECQEKCEA